MPSLFNIPDADPVTSFNSDKPGKNAVLMASTIQGNYQRNAVMWQIIALVSLLSFFISLGIIVYAIHLPKTVPVVVTVNGEGRASYVGAIDKGSYGRQSIPEIAKVYQIKHFIERMNTWVVDRNGQNILIKDAQSVVQEGAIGQLDSFFRANNPFNNFGQRIRIVKMEEPLRQSENLYYVRFETILKTASGDTIANEPWTMLVTLGYYQPSPSNPLGLYITNFDLKPSK